MTIGMMTLFKLTAIIVTVGILPVSIMTARVTAFCQISGINSAILINIMTIKTSTVVE